MNIRNRKYPPSLAEMTTDNRAVRIRGGNKFVLLDIIRKMLKIENCQVYLPGYDKKVKSGLVIDVMGLLRTLEPYEEESAEFAKRALHVVINNKLIQSYIAADRYDGIYRIVYVNNPTVSLKEASCFQGSPERNRKTI